MTAIAKVLGEKEVEKAKQDAELIAKAPPGASLGDGFVFFAAFDGTRDDRNNVKLSGSPLSTNVAVLEGRVRDSDAAHSNVSSRYYAGPGTKDFASALVPTANAIATAQQAYEDFVDVAGKWLNNHPGENVSVVFTAFSRGDIPAAYFSQFVFERGVVEKSTGRVLVPPGEVRLGGGIIFDPVTTGSTASVTYAPGLNNLKIVYADNEYRTLFKGALHTESGISTISVQGNHSDVGGGYDLGLGAIYGDGAARYIEKLIGTPLAPIPEREFDPHAPVVVHTEGVDGYGNRIWGEYGSIEQNTKRQFNLVGDAEVKETSQDGSFHQVFKDLSGQTYEIRRSFNVDGSYETNIVSHNLYGKYSGESASERDAVGQLHSFNIDMDGDGRIDQYGQFNRSGQKVSADWEGYDVSSPVHYRQSTIVENGKVMSVVIDGANNVTIHVSNQQFSIKNSKGIHVEGTGNTIAVDDTVQGVITGDGNAVHGGSHSDVEIHGKDTELHLGESSRARVFGDNPNIYADGQDVVVDTFGSGVHYRSAVSGNVVGLKGTNNDVVGANTTVWFNGDASCNVHGNGNALIIQGTGNFSNAFGDYNYARANGGGNLIAFTGQSQAIDSVGNRVWLNGDSTGYVVGDQNDLIAGGSNVHFNSLGSYLNATSDGLNNSFSFTGQGIKVNAADDTIWFHEKTRGVIYGDGNTVNAAGDNVVLDAYGDWVKVNSSGQNNSVGVSGKNESVSAQGDGVWFNNGATGTVAGDFNTAVASGDKSQVFINGSYATARSTGEQNVFTFQGVHEQAYADADQVWFNQGSNGGVHGDHNLVVANGAKVNVNVIGNIANVVSNAAGNEFHFQGDGSDFTGNDARLMFTAGSDAHINGLNNTVIGLDFTNFLVPATPGVLGMDATVAPILPIQAPYVPFTMPVVVDPMQFSSQVLAGGSSLPMLGNTLNHVEPISMEPPSASFGFIPVSDVELPQIDFLGAYPIWDGESRPALAPLI